MQRIGFIGASGMMGHGMAKNLRAKGWPLALTVHRQRERVADLLAAGATQAASPKALAADSDIVFLCVTGSPQVEASVLGDSGLLAGANQGLLIVDTSTSEPDSTARLREACAARGVRFIDAPLARTPVEAEAGKRGLVVSGMVLGVLLLEWLLMPPLAVLLGAVANSLFGGEPGLGQLLGFLGTSTPARAAFLADMRETYRSGESALPLGWRAASLVAVAFGSMLLVGRAGARFRSTSPF